MVRNKRWLYMLTGGLVIGLALIVIVLLGFSRNDGQNGPAPVVGAVAPEIALLDMNGEPVRLSDLRGRPVVVNFWATWCPPCLEEMPLLQERFIHYDPNLVVLGVNAGESQAAVQNFLARQSLDFDILSDPDGVVQQDYRVRSLPSTFFVDSQGVIQAVHLGLLTGQQLDRYLEKLGVSP